jgi:hypothetical protein
MSYEVNWDRFDLNQDGELNVVDTAVPFQLGLPTSLTQAIVRKVLGGATIPQFDANGNQLTDEQILANGDTPIIQEPFDLNGNGSVDSTDVSTAIADGWPFELTMEIWQYISGGVVPAATYAAMASAFQSTTAGGSGTENPNLSWYPLPHNPLLPHSSEPEPPPPPVIPEIDFGNFDIDFGNGGGFDFGFGADITFPPPNPPPAPEPPPINWDEWHPLDFNQDGVVTVADLLIANSTYGSVVGSMVQRYLEGGMPYDINGDGIVNVVDLMTAQQSGVPAHILAHIQAQVMNPPPPIQDYEPEPELLSPTENDGSAYHPLDFNQDGIVNVVDIVTVAGDSELSQNAKSIIISMIEKYMAGTNPYDINGDGIVNVMDFTAAQTAGVPTIIIQDMVANVGTSAPLPPVPLPAPPPPDPGPTIVEENLWVDSGQYSLLNGTPYYGPVHRIYNNIGEFFMTEKIHKSHSRLLLALTPTPEPAVLETPPGQINIPSLGSVVPGLGSVPALGSVGNNLLSNINLPPSALANLSPAVINALDVLGANLGSFTNMDFSNLNMDFGNMDIGNLGLGLGDGNQTGGTPSDDNNTNNNSGGGGGAF